MIIVLYLLAIVLANLFVTWLGPASTIVNAFLFIGLDLTIRDRLHERWKDRLKRNMALLILAGSVLSFLVNHNALRVACASCIAFAASETVKSIVYWAMRKHSHIKKVNVANLPAAFVDSMLFPTIAFGSLIPWVIIGQFAAKVFGGYVWTLLIHRKERMEVVR